MAKNSQHWHGDICGLLQFECSSATMDTQYCELMYSKLWVTVWRTHSMQRFHSKMTPCTKFPLTEITYAKVCIKEQPLLYVCLRLVSVSHGGFSSTHGWQALSRPIFVIFAVFSVHSWPIWCFDGQEAWKGRPGDKRTEQFTQRQEQDMTHSRTHDVMFTFSSAVMAAAFNVPAIIFHGPLKSPVQKGTVAPHVLWSKEVVPLLTAA